MLDATATPRSLTASDCLTATDPDRLTATPLDRPTVANRDRVAAPDLDGPAAADLDRLAAPELGRRTTTDLHRLTVADLDRPATADLDHPTAPDLTRLGATDLDRPALIPRDHPATVDLDRLGDEIATLSAHLDAATARLLTRLREFDARGGWATGFRSCAEWLSWRAGLDLGSARVRVRVARALGDLPLLAAALVRGELSYSKVRALTRVATPATEARLLAMGQAGTAAHVERLVRSPRIRRAGCRSGRGLAARAGSASGGTSAMRSTSCTPRPSIPAARPSMTPGPSVRPRPSIPAAAQHDPGAQRPAAAQHAAAERAPGPPPLPKAPSPRASTAIRKSGGVCPRTGAPQALGPSSATWTPRRAPGDRSAVS
jgi:hypothetical protein